MEERKRVKQAGIILPLRYARDRGLLNPVILRPTVEDVDESWMPFYAALRTLQRSGGFGDRTCRSPRLSSEQSRGRSSVRDIAMELGFSAHRAIWSDTGPSQTVVR